MSPTVHTRPSASGSSASSVSRTRRSMTKVSPLTTTMA